jgi:hypothetical protein
MHPSDRAWLIRPILTALGAGTLLGVAACGGKAVGDYPGDPEFGEEGGAAGTRGSVGSAGGGAGGGGRAGAGGGGGAAGSVSYGGYGGYSGSASAGAAGAAGSFGMAGSFNTGGYAGSMTMPEPSLCVNLDLGLAGLPTSAFAASDYLASQLCGGRYDDDHVYQAICLPAPANGQSCNSFYPKQLIGVLYSCGLQQEASFVCGPQRPPTGTDGCAGNECCYVLGGDCPVGRPFYVGAEARSAAAARRADWLAPQEPELSRLDAATRRALADVYRKDGLSEHASVASFARFVLECLALGAPAELVSEAQAALADEIAHAQISFGLASAYAGEAVGPGALQVDDCLSGAIDAEDSLRRAIREGCIAETVSASLIHHASETADDPTVKAVLARVADDERRHAALSWRFARWLMTRDPALTRAAAEEFARADRCVGFGASSDLPADAALLRAHGVLSIDERRAVALSTLREVVEPCARALLAAPSPRAPAADVRA